MTSARPTLICVTPVKNEAWILERFLACASCWADHIVLADQCSEDSTRDIAARFSKVRLIENTSPAYDEGARQRLLLESARKLPCAGKRILIALDADEMLSADWASTAEWQQILEAPEGTLLRFEWVNILPGFERCWIPKHDIPFGFVDDGSLHTGEKIHSTRLPTPPGAPSLSLKAIKVLHYQYTDWPRMKSKQRWYQCWEHLNMGGKRPIQIYRQYHQMDARPPEELHPMRPEWLERYELAGIDMRTVPDEPFYRWDREIIEMFEQHGVAKFRRLGIWEVDWAEIGRCMGGRQPTILLKDPRTSFEKSVHRWLTATQPRQHDGRVRTIQRLLRLFGW